eukprot:CAMPEP_0194184170 /NCGR_PEP_ID=MMETSP0154-20130528/36167_1 /TAXON_ID=1049557 /ORGANISM="Thalassiothrix antarctica, Strain L6-D1" /LENGTH=226 /DNA_ID=CAMNT_0038901623 /DNA_START=67 /DNA_END=744 /DNA_ORIENTATION=-
MNLSSVLSPLLLAVNAAAFVSVSKTIPTIDTTTSLQVFTVDNLPGAIPPVGFFDPLGFAKDADSNTLKSYREAELTHGRVAMVATIGFLVGEAVGNGNTPLFDGAITGAAIGQLGQAPGGFYIFLIFAIGALEVSRLREGFIDVKNVDKDEPGTLKDDYYPGDIGFDPFGLKPEDPEEFEIMVTKELQHGRLAMLASSGFIAQELTDGKGIIEHFQGGDAAAPVIK